MSHLANLDLIILFFFLGGLASWLKSDLAIPESISKFLSIFLLLSLGLKGGQEVRMAQNFEGFLPSLSIGMASCLALPMILFFLLRSKTGIANAAAISASYGSVSAVTFVTAQGLLTNEGIDSNGYMVAIMALMEIPAILVAVYLYQKFSSQENASNQHLLKSVLSAKSVILLLGGFAIGILMNQSSWIQISPVVQGCFKGVLAFFLLDLGIVAQKQFGNALKYFKIAIPLGLLAPLIAGTMTLVIGQNFGVSKGDLILLSVLVGSASYIAAPAAIRSSIPQANPSLYLALPLALTFPMNLIFGIPLYIELSEKF